MISEMLQQHLKTQQETLQECLKALQANLDGNNQIMNRLSQVEERMEIIESEFQLLKDYAPDWQTLETDSKTLLEGYENIKVELNQIAQDFKLNAMKYGVMPQELNDILTELKEALPKLKN